MTDIDQAAALDIGEPHGHGPLVKWLLIAVVLLLLIVVGGGVWYFLLGGRAHFVSEKPKEIEAPLPYFQELKPFVVSMSNNSGVPHFVQLGVSLQLAGSGAGEMVTAVLPEVQDAMRQTLITFKTEDLQTPDGVNKVRRAMVEHLNEMFARVLGPERIAKITAGKPDVKFVQNILFATLIIE